MHVVGLKRCGKSCRLRWMNYLRPDIKRGNISDDEEDLIIRLHKLLGNRCCVHALFPSFKELLSTLLMKMDKWYLVNLFLSFSTRWSLIAGRLPGRTDNEIKNYWHTNIAKKAQHSQSRKQPGVDRKQIASGSENGATASNFKNQTIESQYCTTGVVVPSTALQENNMAQDHLVSTLAMAPSNTHHENESSSKGLASGDNDNLSNILMDFHYMEDFYKILDSDFPKLSDLNDITSTANHSNNTIQVDGDHYSVSINGCNPREIAGFSELLEADWTSNKCVQAEQGFDFMSLLSFLDLTDE